MEAAEIQKKYYSQTASSYDDLHLKPLEEGEHDFALHYLSAVIHQYDIKKLLDVGAGTGRTIDFLMHRHPALEIKGVEPVKELRDQGHKKGISDKILIDGDGCNLPFADQSFDLVCEFGVLHHVPQPEKMVGEMLRVGKKAIFISDNNNFGQGGTLGRLVKQVLHAVGLWRLFDKIRTKGKGYHMSDGDGLFYSYSVFNNIPQIEEACRKVHLLNTNNTSFNFYRSATHLAVLGIKK